MFDMYLKNLYRYSHVLTSKIWIVVESKNSLLLSLFTATIFGIILGTQIRSSYKGYWRKQTFNSLIAVPPHQLHKKKRVLPNPVTQHALFQPQPPMAQCSAAMSKLPCAANQPYNCLIGIFHKITIFMANATECLSPLHSLYCTTLTSIQPASFITHYLARVSSFTKQTSSHPGSSI